MRDRVIFEDISYVNAYIWLCLNMYACVSVCMRLCFGFYGSHSYHHSWYPKLQLCSHYVPN